MVLAFKLPSGAEMHEPPYTEEEEMEIYRRIGGGPISILHDPEAMKRLEARLNLAKLQAKATAKEQPKS